MVVLLHTLLQQLTQLMETNALRQRKDAVERLMLTKLAFYAVFLIHFFIVATWEVDSERYIDQDTS